MIPLPNTKRFLQEKGHTKYPLMILREKNTVYILANWILF